MHFHISYGTWLHIVISLYDIVVHVQPSVKWRFYVVAYAIKYPSNIQWLACDCYEQNIEFSTLLCLHILEMKKLIKRLMEFFFFTTLKLQSKTALIFFPSSRINLFLRGNVSFHIFPIHFYAMVPPFFSFKLFFLFIIFLVIFQCTFSYCG